LIARTSARGGMRGGFSTVDTIAPSLSLSNLGDRQAFCRALADASTPASSGNYGAVAVTRAPVRR
jgi:hypothetical protein